MTTIPSLVTGTYVRTIFYRKWIINNLGSYEGADAYVKIVEFVKQYINKTTKNSHFDGKDIFSTVAQTKDGETCLASVTLSKDVYTRSFYNQLTC